MNNMYIRMQSVRVCFFVVLFLLGLGKHTCIAQTISLYDKIGKPVNGDTLEVNFLPGPDHGWTELYVNLMMRNNADSARYFLAKKTEYIIRNDEYHSICFAGFCFDSSVIVSQYAAWVGAHQIDSSFSGHFRFDDLLHPPGVCLVAYTFFAESNNNDSAIVYVKYNTKLFSGLDRYINGEAAKFYFYPNPFGAALHMTHLPPTENTLSFFDVQGRLVYQQKLVSGFEAMINIGNNLLPGMYLIQLNNFTMVRAVKID